MNRIERAEQQAVLERLRRDASFLAERFKLPLRSVDAEGPRVKRRYGICYEDGSIRIRLRNVRNGEILKYSALVDTLCHELAHLRHFDHGLRFQALYKRVLGYARRQGLYRPSRRPSPGGGFAPRPPSAPPSPRVRGPIQLELFGAPPTDP